MARSTINLLELNIEKLFEDHSIDEIMEIDKILDVEIERKRTELRSMVGDRYKDVLAASDAIKSMKIISESIVNNIEQITDTCDDVIKGPTQFVPKAPPEVDKRKVAERTLVIQLRLALFINEEIWTALDENNNLGAAQYYLLAQHIHMGLSLTKKEYLDRIPLLTQIKESLTGLRSRICQRIIDNLESVEITAQETSCNLNALMLLQNQTSQDLLSVFVEHRKTALCTVINTSHLNVRLQISAMVRCLVSTIQLLHDCFIEYSNNKKGMIWRQLDAIIGEASPPILSKLQLPKTPLLQYIPEIIKNFKPKCRTVYDETTCESMRAVLENWLKSTHDSVKAGVQKSLQLVTNVKGLHIIREESLKIELPGNWDEICRESNLPDNFNVWYYFFQSLLTSRVKELISLKIKTSIKEVQSDIKSTLETAGKVDGNTESDLRWYAWHEDDSDVSKSENRHDGLSMKTRGYSKNIVSLCSSLDKKYLDLLEDVWQYFYGIEYSLNAETRVNLNYKDFKHKKKFIDKELLEHHLRLESTKESSQISAFILDLVKKSNTSVVKSLICARFLQGIQHLCPKFQKCCTFNSSTDDWLKICDNFSKTSHILLENWVESCVQVTGKEVAILDSAVHPCNMITMIAKWDCIEIQEQTDEKTFKSQIKVPLKPSLSLNKLLVQLNDALGCVLPHTLPRLVHAQFIEKNIQVILLQYQKLAEMDLNQIQALQFLFDVKFLTMFCIQRDNVQLVTCSQEICDKLRNKIDPFDLDVFYSYLQSNVKRAVCQSAMILGCLLPSPGQLASLGISEKNKEHEKDPSLLALSVPSHNSWFPLLPITVPTQKTSSAAQTDNKNVASKPPVKTPKKVQDPATVVRSSAAALFGNLTTDWFS